MKKHYLLILIFALLSFPSFSQNCNYICNSNFEAPVISASPFLLDSTTMSCWRTTANDGIMELWLSGFNGVPAFSGNQFIELNANFASTIFQNIAASPGLNLVISFAHRGRAGVDTMSVSAGPVGGPYTTLGYFADGTTAWGYYSVNYVVPNMGNDYSVRFNSVYATLNSGAIGNFLDSVTVCATNLGVHEISTENNSFSLFNPSEDNLLLNYFSENAQQNVLLNIYTLAGTLVKTTSFTAVAGMNKINFNLKELNAGLYFINLIADNKSSVKKWVKY